MSIEFYRAPKAYRYEVHFCGACPHAHLIFFDEKNLAICEAVISARQSEAVAKEIREKDPNFRG